MEEVIRKGNSVHQWEGKDHSVLKTKRKEMNYRHVNKCVAKEGRTEGEHMS